MSDKKNELFTVEENQPVCGTNVKVIGVGGGGGNAINYIFRDQEEKKEAVKIDLMIANTDNQVLQKSPVEKKILLGANTTRGLGAGADPSVGRAAALENKKSLEKHLEGADITFIAAGFGGGTGTGAAPIVAEIAQEQGALTVAVVTTPFDFEGKKRNKNALAGLEELKKVCNSVIVIQNEKLMGLIDEDMGIKDSFKIVDSVLARAVCGMYSVILEHGESDINLDFNDVKRVMSHKGLAVIGTGSSDSGSGSASEAIKEALESPLIDSAEAGGSIKGAMGILVHFKTHPKYPLSAVYAAMKIIDELADEDADVLFGTTTTENMKQTEVNVTIIATGFEKQKKEAVLPVAESKQDKEELPNLRRLKISGDSIEIDYNDLDKPTFIRHSLD